MALGDAVRVLGPDVAPVVLDVRLVEPLAVDVDERRATAESDPDALARQADDPLHERPPRAALRLGGGGVSNTTMSPRSGSRMW